MVAKEIHNVLTKLIITVYFDIILTMHLSI